MGKWENGNYLPHPSDKGLWGFVKKIEEPTMITHEIGSVNEC